MFEGSIVIPLFVSNFIVILLIFYFGTDRTRQRNAYKNKIAKLESSTLKAQMNPHFIFNTLNGIQSVMILKGEKKANEYISIFSKMLRKTLEISFLESMSLQEELDYINSFIVLQNIRRKNPITYHVDIASGLTTKECLIPPMLLQPIVENALIHGIEPTKEDGCITISISEKENALKVVVKDNGVGRKKAQLNNKNSNKENRTSYGTKILRERIDILNFLHKEKTDFMLSNIVKNGKINGTQATLILPKINNQFQKLQ